MASVQTTPGPPTSATDAAAVASGAGGALVGAGILTFVLFPFAIPFLLLTAVFAAPLLIVPLALALPVAIAAGAAAAIRAIGRRLTRGDRRSEPLPRERVRPAGC